MPPATALAGALQPKSLNNGYGNHGRVVGQVRSGVGLCVRLRVRVRVLHSYAIKVKDLVVTRSSTEWHMPTITKKHLSLVYTAAASCGPPYPIQWCLCG